MSYFWHSLIPKICILLSKKNERPIKRLFKDSNTVCLVLISPKINITMKPLRSLN